MQYYSLNRKAPVVDFRQATIAGQAPDKGLYFPSQIPSLTPQFIRDIHNYSDIAIAMEVMRPYISGSIPDKVLERILEATLSFPLPLVAVTEDIFALELFHGPTLAFKDIGARFMSRCLGYFLREEKQRVIVLTATSGDTGGAVANGFHKVPGIDVVVLYPEGKVSAVQEAQITGPGDNIHTLKIKGSFDDCQSLVKAAFADEALRQQLFLTSANSINVARWLPQQLYYFLAWKQWADKSNPPLIAVPSGNFGNISAGVLAQLSGLPVAGFIAACNANATVPDYLVSGTYRPKKTVPTLSNAMDVSDPSNFVRLLELLGNEYALVKDAIKGAGISDKTTLETIKRIYEERSYLTDPHGAVAYAALEKELLRHPGRKGIFLETAHPVKFSETICTVLGDQWIKEEHKVLLAQKAGNSTSMESDYDAFKAYLLQSLRG